MRITQTTDRSFVLNSVEWGTVWLWLPLFLFTIWIMFQLSGGQDPAPFWVYLIFSMIPLTLGGLTVLSPRRSQLVLDRTKNTAELRRSSMIGYDKLRFDLPNVDCVYISQKLNTEAALPDAATGLITLRVDGGMDEGSYSLNTYPLARTKLDPIVDAANTWLDRTP
ncbi:hypothetical protein [Pseudooctadecabacter jejudonensis]|uniref:DUF304 domain-containing protein n=1 Tax=Pseudooctadecabacter jejudonensis TaxID=1391910 RepID=A0A1Y5T4F7_9RHOB|nr:hypothetical protein [Pseudooctadecabacter jejudonensis]SLN55660.1 hypothetical protein PSJ8397_02934 [Pseudooctadecabacter jejudonensis]